MHNIYIYIYISMRKTIKHIDMYMHIHIYVIYIYIYIYMSKIYNYVCSWKFSSHVSEIVFLCFPVYSLPKNRLSADIFQAFLQTFLRGLN